MQILTSVGVLLLAYLIGSIPNGFLIVKIFTGKDVRQIESGRTGGTNALRAAGFWAGLSTALLDITKGALAVLVAKYFFPQDDLIPYNDVIHVLAATAAILGHNYSIFMPEFSESGKLMRLRGGAGGAPALGGAIGLWGPVSLIILPLGVIVYFTIGYASVTTISIAFFAFLVFGIRYLQDPGNNHLAYVAYGLIAMALLGWALRPNFVKLMEGNERVISISLHGWLKKRKEKQD